VAAGQAKKAADVKVLDLRDVTSFTDFFVLMSGGSVRQVQAIVDAIEDRLRAEGEKPTHVEGYAQGEWVLLDYSDFVVHVFSPPKREFYDLERLWRDAGVVRVPETAT
jgi:ribosome-associated protein